MKLVTVYRERLCTVQRRNKLKSWPLDLITWILYLHVEGRPVGGKKFGELVS
jgi:hypothetical protein